MNKDNTLFQAGQSDLPFPEVSSMRQPESNPTPANKDISKMNIWQKLLSISEEIEMVEKTLLIKVGNESYKAVAEGAVIAAVKPLEISYNVYSFPISRTWSPTMIMTTKSGTPMIHTRCETIYRFVNTDKPEEYVDIPSAGDGVDTQDKAPGKAMTYADKYALLKAYKIQTGDDPDQYGSEEMNQIGSATTTTKKRLAPPTSSQKVNQYGEIMDLIRDTKFTLEDVSEWIYKRFKKNIKINDLDQTQFNELMDAIKKALEQE